MFSNAFKFVCSPSDFYHPKSTVVLRSILEESFICNEFSQSYGVVKKVGFRDNLSVKKRETRKLRNVLTKKVLQTNLKQYFFFFPICQLLQVIDMRTIWVRQNIIFIFFKLVKQVVTP